MALALPRTHPRSCFERVTANQGKVDALRSPHPATLTTCLVMSLPCRRILSTLDMGRGLPSAPQKKESQKGSVNESRSSTSISLVPTVPHSSVILCTYSSLALRGDVASTVRNSAERAARSGRGKSVCRARAEGYRS